MINNPRSQRICRVHAKRILPVCLLLLLLLFSFSFPPSSSIRRASCVHSNQRTSDDGDAKRFGYRNKTTGFITQRIGEAGYRASPKAKYTLLDLVTGWGRWGSRSRGASRTHFPADEPWINTRHEHSHRLRHLV